VDGVEKRKFLTLPGLELRPLGHPASSQSLYRLSYCGSCKRLYLHGNNGRPTLGETGFTCQTDFILVRYLVYRATIDFALQGQLGSIIIVTVSAVCTDIFLEYYDPFQCLRTSILNFISITDHPFLRSGYGILFALEELFIA
jgi:hypothetical protein